VSDRILVVLAPNIPIANDYLHQRGLSYRNATKQGVIVVCVTTLEKAQQLMGIHTEPGNLEVVMLPETSGHVAREVGMRLAASIDNPTFRRLTEG